MKTTWPCCFVLATVALLAGCARYEYDVVAPEQATGHVGTKAWHRFTLDPLEYRLRAVDNRLVMHVHNPTDDPVTLLGAQSSAVDPRGQSHPLRTQTIAAGNSYIKIILPPPRPRVYRGGPTIGFGVGTTIGRARGRGVYGGAGYGIDDYPHDDEPRYMTVYDDADTVYWDWKGEGQVRLNLVYQAPGREAPFTHALTIRRGKVN
jgi:hypothetical protein